MKKVYDKCCGIDVHKKLIKYQDLGADYYNQFNRERKINAYLKKLKELGWTESKYL